MLRIVVMPAKVCIPEFYVGAHLCVRPFMGRHTGLPLLDFRFLPGDGKNRSNTAN